jgi:Mn-dependent DtxR family transcriptional regulator
LKDVYSEAPTAEIAEVLKVSAEEVRQRAKLLGLKKWASAPWTAREKARLANLYPRHTNGDIARRLGKTENAVNEMAYRLRLKKPPEFRSQAIREVRRRKALKKQPGSSEK